MNVKLTAYTPDPVRVMEEAASTCYDSQPSADGKIINACYQSGHHSVLEHASFTFLISGVSRALLAQLTRHRVGVAFSVRSQRYCLEVGKPTAKHPDDRFERSKDNPLDFEYVVPPSIASDPHASDTFRSVMKSLAGCYVALVGLGIPQEDARFVLPNACATTITCTMNMRELIHFCNERLCSRAQWEIRALAKAMADEVIGVMPMAKNWLVPKCEKNARFPFCPERECCGRHPKLSACYYRDGAERE